MSDTIQILELFGGIGSPRCALRNLNIPTKAIDYVEINEKAVRSYNSMFREELAYKTQTVVGWNLKPDILIHGSPCQDMSIAGHQGKATGDGRINRGKGSDEGSGTRSSLMWETIHIIENMGEWRPRYVIWENVKNVKSNTQRKRTVFRLYIDHTGSQSILLRELLCELLETFERSAAYQRSVPCESSSSVQLNRCGVHKHRTDTVRNIRRLLFKNGNGIRHRKNPDRCIRK